MGGGGRNLYFGYDGSGKPYAMWYRGTNYYYVTNLQGDVIGILDNAGNQIVTYTYDAWGNILSVTGSHAATIGQYNPLRYRGYVYDTELELYCFNPAIATKHSRLSTE